MSNSPVSLCIVGLGWWGGEIAKAAAKIKNCKIAACYARTPATREAFSKTHGCRVMESWEAVLQDEEIDALILTTPHSTHARMVVEAASAGKHVLVDKPFVLHVPDGQRAVAACKNADVRLAVDHQRRRQPAHKEMKRIIESGQLGQIVQAEGNISYGINLTIDPNAWRGDPAECPAGSMTAMGVHAADLYFHFLGPVKSLIATSRSVHPRTRIDDVTTILLEFESGVEGYLGTNALTQRMFFIQALGIEGIVRAENEGSRLTLFQKGVDAPTVTDFPVEGDPVTLTLAEELADFAESVQFGNSPAVDGETALHACAILEAISVSDREGRRVELAEMYE